MVTMQDVANLAKVSRGTVSSVLNGRYKKAKISKITRDKIFEVAAQLNYRRNALALSIKTGKTNVIGFIGGLYTSYCMEIIRGINNVALKNDYMVKLLPIDRAEDVKNAARLCVEQCLAGVICRSLNEESLENLRKELEPNNIPVVLVDSSFSHDWCSRVISDDFDGAKQATEYLLKLGHRRIMHLTNDLSCGFSKIRYDGFCAAMGEIETQNICIIDNVLELTKNIRQAISEALLKQRPTAVFCASDPIAMKLIIIASELGLKIPDDLSIIGYAGLELSAITNPPLTTIAQNFANMGKKASDILLSEIKEKSIKQEVKLPVELVIRNSVKKRNST